MLGYWISDPAQLELNHSGIFLDRQILHARVFPHPKDKISGAFIHQFPIGISWGLLVGGIDFQGLLVGRTYPEMRKI